MSRGLPYIQSVNDKKDNNPYANDCVEVWYSFEGYAPTSSATVRKICYDAMGVGEHPFSAMSEGIYSDHFSDSSAKATYQHGYDPAAEYSDRAIIEFKIPAKYEGGDDLLVEDDRIYFALQINDINAGADNLDVTPAECGHTWTRGRTVFPDDNGSMGGYFEGYLTLVTPDQVTVEE